MISRTKGTKGRGPRTKVQDQGSARASKWAFFQKTFVKDMFDAMDSNRDGVTSRDGWDTVVKFLAEGKNSAFALKAGGTGNVSRSSVLWAETKGLPYISSGIVVGGQFVMVKDGGGLPTWLPT